MSLEELIQNFISHKKSKPEDVNELLDYVQRNYISNNLCIVQYRELFRELHERGALKPDYTLNPN
ncbi:YppF family protein [Anaerobacillus sp. MEB173]|uniref:YppF family protein n=1 Tax=Anaerobacillus sp. MEB173 TaxID=3383345 RepID=UPI003F8DABE5